MLTGYSNSTILESTARFLNAYDSLAMLSKPLEYLNNGYMYAYACMISIVLSSSENNSYKMNYRMQT